MFILPAYLVSLMRGQPLGERTGLNASSTPQAVEDSSAVLKDAQEKISLLQPSSNNLLATKIISRLIAAEPNGVKVNGISYGAGVDGIELSGVASSRESLSLFTDNLHSQFKNATVNLPVSSFAKDRNIDFSLNIKGSF